MFLWEFFFFATLFCEFLATPENSVTLYNFPLFPHLSLSQRSPCFCRHEQKQTIDNITEYANKSHFFSSLPLYLFLSPTQNKRAVYTDVPDSSLCLNLIRCFESVFSIQATGVQSSLFFSSPTPPLYLCLCSQAGWAR